MKIKTTVAAWTLAFLGLFAVSVEAQTCGLQPQIISETQLPLQLVNTPPVNSYTIVGSGFGPIGGQETDSYFAPGLPTNPFVGDFTFIAQLTGLTGGTSPYAGMYLGPNGNHNAILLRYYVDSSGKAWVEFNDTWTTSWGKVAVTGLPWLKVVRAGTVYSAYESADGVNYNTVWYSHRK